MFDKASSDKLLHHVSRELARLHVVRELHDLLLQQMNLLVLLRDVFFLLGCSFFLCLNLRLSPATLTGDLQHVC